MTTRLMQVTPVNGEPTREDCARLAALKAQGKVQQLPPACLKPAQTPPPGQRVPAAVAKTGGSL
jgi:hypothetical protein